MIDRVEHIVWVNPGYTLPIDVYGLLKVAIFQHGSDRIDKFIYGRYIEKERGIVKIIPHYGLIISSEDEGCAGISLIEYGELCD